MRCNRHSSFKDQFKYEHYYPCEKIATHRIFYIDSFRSEPKSELVCKMHFNAMKKNCDRIQKTTGFDSKLTFELIDHGKEETREDTSTTPKNTSKS